MGSPRGALLDAVGALPQAVNPLALSLNECPFAPLPAVRSALNASIDAAKRYYNAFAVAQQDLPEAKRLKELETENARLKKLLAEMMLENEIAKEALRKKW